MAALDSGRIKKATLTAIGDAIRERAGTAALLKPFEMPAAIRAITGAEATVTYGVENAVTAAYLSEVEYDPGDYSVSEIADYAGQETSYRKDQPSGAAVTLPAGELYLLDAANGGTTHETISAGAHTICNLTPGKVSGYYVIADGKIAQAGGLAPTGTLRMLKADRIGNLRDLGGWACDGGTVRYGLIFRGSRWAYGTTMSDHDKRLFLDLLKLRVEVDLRYAGEDAAVGTPTFEGVDYVWYAGQCQYAAVLQNPDAGALFHDCMQAAIDGKPQYIHCVSGADRTGTVLFILGAVLGMSQSDLDKDYELTSMRTGVSTDAERRGRDESPWTGLISAFAAMDGETMRDKVCKWLVTKGVSVPMLNAFRAAMIDGTPETLDYTVQTYTVTNTLTNCTTDNADTTATQYQPYTATITPASGYKLTGASVTVTMGGVDITSAAYSNGVISIAQATGNISITVSAINAYTNVILESTTEPGGSELFNGTGYQQGYRYDSSGNLVQYANANGCFATGYFPVQPGDVLHFYGKVYSGSSNTWSAHAYDASGAHLYLLTPKHFQGGDYDAPTFAPYVWDSEQTALLSMTIPSGVAYMRFTGVGVMGADKIITVNEEVS